MATLQQYEKHARLYGTDCIWPTVVAEGDLSARERVDLKVALADIAKTHRAAKRPPNWYDDVPKIDADDVVGLAHEGFTASEIVAHTKMSLPRVEKLMPTPSTLRQGKIDPRDVTAVDRLIMAGAEVPQVPEVVSEPSNHAGSSSEFVGDAPKTGNRTPDAVSPMRTPAAQAKAAATRARREAQKDEDILRLYLDRQMVPGGIAKKLGVGEARVRKLIRNEKEQTT
jgi:hypothetical protein